MLKFLRDADWKATLPFALVVVIGLITASLVPHPNQEAVRAGRTQLSDNSSNQYPLETWAALLAAFFTGAIAYYAVLQYAASQRSSERQLRAYVMIQGMEFARPDTPNGDNQLWATHIIFKNSGQTPAYKVVVTTEIEIGVTEKPQDVLLSLTDAKRVHPESVLAPGSPQTARLSEGLYGGAAEFHEHAAANLIAYVWGRVDYVDIFGRPHWTTFQGVNYFDQVPQFAYCKAGNRTDDEF